jgi:hypothetical protein
MTDSKRSPYSLWFNLIVPVAVLILAATLAPAGAVPPITLKVSTSHGLPGLHHSALSRFLATHMADASLANWRFEPAGEDVSAGDRVEWTLRLNPYAGGEVRHFAPILADERRLGLHRPITIEARLYLNGQYQTMVERQATIQGGPDDPDLAAAVANATRDLLGPAGAYRAINIGQHPGSPLR